MQKEGQPLRRWQQQRPEHCQMAASLRLQSPRHLRMLLPSSPAPASSQSSTVRSDHPSKLSGVHHARDPSQTRASNQSLMTETLVRVMSYVTTESCSNDSSSCAQPHLLRQRRAAHSPAQQSRRQPHQCLQCMSVPPGTLLLLLQLPGLKHPPLPLGLWYVPDPA